MWIRRKEWDDLCEHVRSLESSAQQARHDINHLRDGIYVPAMPRAYPREPGSYLSFSEAIHRIAQKVGVQFVKVEGTPARFELQPLPKPKK